MQGNNLFSHTARFSNVKFFVVKSAKLFLNLWEEFKFPAIIVDNERCQSCSGYHYKENFENARKEKSVKFSTKSTPSDTILQEKGWYKTK